MKYLTFEEAVDRGETVVALIESGWRLYFGEPCGHELLMLIAAADARRDVKSGYTTLDY